MNDKFTAPAKAKWDSIPPQIQKKLLKNVWCTKCAGVTTIKNFKGEIDEGDLILTGTCITCDGQVVRVIEGG